MTKMRAVGVMMKLLTSDESNEAMFVHHKIRASFATLSDVESRQSPTLVTTKSDWLNTVADCSITGAAGRFLLHSITPVTASKQSTSVPEKRKTNLLNCRPYSEASPKFAVAMGYEIPCRAFVYDQRRASVAVLKA